jgi:hypothetical protein
MGKEKEEIEGGGGGVLFVKTFIILKPKCKK